MATSAVRFKVLDDLPISEANDVDGVNVRGPAGRLAVHVAGEVKPPASIASRSV
ncbi:MAG: hypothetical protein ACHQ0J_02445 [Candidatus Dormibacterales bacterium]